MQLSRITAMIIQGNDVDCYSTGPDKNGKYAGWLSRMGRRNYRALINTGAMYETPEEAVSEMNKIVDGVKQLKL